MIDLGTLAGLLEPHHRLDAYCPRCDRWSVLPLAESVARGHADKSRIDPFRIDLRQSAYAEDP